MRPAENIEKLIKNIEIDTNAKMDKAVLNDALKAFEKSKKEKSAELQPNIWRMIMKRPITKLATAAAVLLIVASAVTVLNYSGTPAYALEQTIKASHTIRYLHVRDFKVGEEEPKEFWLEFDESGIIENVRLHIPSWDNPLDGPKVCIWNQGVAEVWLKKKNVLAVIKDKAVADRMLAFAEKCDPKLAVQKLYKEQAQGDVQVEVDEPSDKSEFIVVTATYGPKSSGAGTRDILYVDQATKLVVAIDSYKFKDGQYQQVSSAEFCSYNQQIDPKMFTLDNVPDDAIRIDQVSQEVGLAQGELSDKDIAKEVVRQFLEALIERDYARAGRLFSGASAERMEKTYGNIRFIRIISIGEPVSHSLTGGFYVPCTVEIEENGEISQWQPKHSYVRQVHGQLGRWLICGGFRGV